MKEMRILKETMEFGSLECGSLECGSLDSSSSGHTTFDDDFKDETE